MLPAVVESILQGWSLQLGGRDEAMRRWAMLHGGMTAGVTDPMATLARLGWLETDHPVTPARAASPASTQEVVTVMHTPPLPRAWRKQEADQPAMTNRPSARQTEEDVCLL